MTAASEQEWAQVAELAAAVQEVAFVDQGYTGEAAEQAAAKERIKLQVVKHTEANGRDGRARHHIVPSPVSRPDCRRSISRSRRATG